MFHLRERFAKCRIERYRCFESAKRRRQVSGPPDRAAQISMRLGVVRLKFDCLLVAGNRLLRRIGHLVRIRKIVERFRKCG